MGEKLRRRYARRLPSSEGECRLARGARAPPRVASGIADCSFDTALTKGIKSVSMPFLVLLIVVGLAGCHCSKSMPTSDGSSMPMPESSVPKVATADAVPNVGADDEDALLGVPVPQGLTAEQFKKCRPRAIQCQSASLAVDAAACPASMRIEYTNVPMPSWGMIPLSPRATARRRPTEPKTCCYVDFTC